MKKAALLTVCCMLLFCGCSEGKLGQTCESDQECDFGEVCSAGDFCTCSAPELILYQSTAPYVRCSRENLGLVECPSAQCPNNSLCTENSRCGCVEGHVRMGNECHPGKKQQIFDSCASDTQFVYCPQEEFLTCTDSNKCFCFENHYYNYSSLQCEPMTPYLQKYNLSEYRVQPGMYCTDDEQCIEGLECKSYKCSCPDACDYVEGMAACYCGVDTGTLVGVIFIGGFLHLFVFLFWCVMFCRICTKYPTDKPVELNNEPPDAYYNPRYRGEDDLPAGDPAPPYDLDPADQPTAPPLSAAPAHPDSPHSDSKPS